MVTDVEEFNAKRARVKLLERDIAAEAEKKQQLLTER